MTVFLFSSSILDRNNEASSAYRDLGITPVLLSSILASDAKCCSFGPLYWAGGPIYHRLCELGNLTGGGVNIWPTVADYSAATCKNKRRKMPLWIFEERAKLK
jgi:hypothetical protein